MPGGDKGKYTDKQARKAAAEKAAATRKHKASA
jgi:hypothetical protein